MFHLSLLTRILRGSSFGLGHVQVCVYVPLCVCMYMCECVCVCVLRGSCKLYPLGSKCFLNSLTLNMCVQYVCLCVCVCVCVCVCNRDRITDTFTHAVCLITHGLI